MPSASAVERRIGRRIARQRHRALGPGESAARLIGRRFDLVDIGGGGPALKLQRPDPLLFGLLLVERAFGRGIIGFGLIDLQTKIGVVEPRQRIALPDDRAGVDETLGEFAGNAEGEIALDARLDDPGQNALLRRGARSEPPRPEPGAAGVSLLRLRRRVARRRAQKRASRAKTSERTCMTLTPKLQAGRPAGSCWRARAARSRRPPRPRIGSSPLHWAISVGWRMPAQASIVILPSIAGIAGAKFARRLALRDELADQRVAGVEEFLDRRPSSPPSRPRPLHERACGGSSGRDDCDAGSSAPRRCARPACPAPPRRREPSASRLPSMVAADRFGQRVLRGKEAVDIGAGHAERPGDVGDRRLAKADLAKQIPGRHQNALAGFFRGSAGEVHWDRE